MHVTTFSRVQQHNERPAAVWSAGGKDYDEISRGIADSIEHCVLRLNPRPGERILDLSTGTGWTSRLVARQKSARRFRAQSRIASPRFCPAFSWKTFTARPRRRST